VSRRTSVAALLLAAAALGSVLQAQSPSGMTDTKHNLSVSGPGPIRALNETRICVFCHTPHNAKPLTPMWNKDLEAQVYTVYASPTLRAGPLPQPAGPTKLCLSCHDGTIAMGAVMNPSGGIAMAGSDTLPPGSLSDFGMDLSGHHPVSFSYGAALPNPELLPSPPPGLDFGGYDEVHCITCHDPHEDRYGKFLVKDNRFSELCTSCHQMSGWVGSAHATSTESVEGILPRPPKTWPTWTQMNEWGCETCHAPHFAATAEQLLNFTAAPPAPFSCTSAGCHGSDPGSPHVQSASRVPSLVRSGAAVSIGVKDIGRQVRKVSGHREPAGSIPLAVRVPGGAARTGVRSVACADCHNPHTVRARDAQAPYASGLLQGVSGVDRNGAAVSAATYEYEVCFKCHSDNTPDLDTIPRVLETTNTRLAFDSDNPSFHPVVDPGRNLNIPSIPSTFEPSMSPSQSIYCSDCHADDEGGSRGPHGSSFAPLLRERYEITDNTPESYDNYALCYRCHERQSIVRDDSFRKRTFRSTASGGGHSGHLAAGAPCSVCHDPHGVNDSGRIGPTGTGSHTHLINFDTRSVLPKPGAAYPVFNDTGEFSGSCTLTCHGVTHDATSYP
jgi:predicted CXXCH cytochrome family protein